MIVAAYVALAALAAVPASSNLDAGGAAAPTPHARVRAAARLASVGRTLEAEARLREAIAEAPDLAEAHANLGAVLHRLGRFDEAETAYRAALERSPDLREARLGLGLTLLAADRPESALPVLGALAADRPGDVEAVTALGWAAFRSDSTTGAADAFDRAVFLDPHRAEAHLGRSFVLERRGLLDEAAAAAAEAVTADASDYASLYHLGRLERLRGRPRAARAALERAVAAAPGRPEAPMLLARLLAEEEAYAEAVEAAAAAEAADPASPPPPAWRGHAAEGAARPPDATAAFRAALDRDPSDEVLRHRLEEALAASDRPDSAGREAMARWRLERAAAARARGDRLGARRHLLRAVRVAPLYAPARAALARAADAEMRWRDSLDEWAVVLDLSLDPVLRREAEDRRAAAGRAAVLEWAAATGRAPGPLLSAHPLDAAAAVEEGALDRLLVEAGGLGEAHRRPLAVAVRAPADAYHPGVGDAAAREIAALLRARFDAAPLDLPKGAGDAEALALARRALAGSTGGLLLLVDLEREDRAVVAGRLRLLDPGRRDAARPAVLDESPVRADGPGAFAEAVLQVVRTAGARPPVARVIDLGPGIALVGAGRTEGFAPGTDVVLVRARPGADGLGRREGVVGRGRVESTAEGLAAIRLVEGDALPGDLARGARPPQSNNSP